MNRLCKAIAGIGLSIALWSTGAIAADDPVVFSFAFVGCNRLDKAGADATGSVSTANVAQLLQDFKDVANTRPAPQYLILAGDVVLGFKGGTGNLKRELDAWSALVKDQLNPKTTLVAFAGNHELLEKKEDGAKGDVPNQPAYPYWQDNMRGFTPGNDGPPQGGPDQLVNDEKRLSYSFRSGPYYFLVLNTDTQIDDKTTGDIPMRWIESKLMAAQQDPTIKHVFVMGHKPIAVPGTPADDGVGNIRKTQGVPFYALLSQPAAGAKESKVRAYLSAHAHEWNYQANLESLGFRGTIPQIIAGNGGSLPNKNWLAPDAYFGYTLVTVMASGKVIAQSYGRSIPTPDYYAQKPAPLPATPQGPAHVLYSLN